VDIEEVLFLVPSGVVFACGKIVIQFRAKSSKLSRKFCSWYWLDKSSRSCSMQSF